MPAADEQANVTVVLEWSVQPIAYISSSRKQQDEVVSLEIENLDIGTWNRGVTPYVNYFGVPRQVHHLW